MTVIIFRMIDDDSVVLIKISQTNHVKLLICRRGTLLADKITEHVFTNA